MLQILELYNVFTSEKTLDEFQTLYVENLFSPIDIFCIVLLYRYFVFNFVDFNLHQAIRSKTSISEVHIKFIIYPILRSLKVEHLFYSIHIHLSEMISVFFCPLVYSFSLYYSPCK